MKKLIASMIAGVCLSTAANAATEITWWHAMGGNLGETVNAIAKDFNASQSDVILTPVYKGGYEDTMTAGIAAFRAGEQPHIIQIFDAGAATIINAKGAVLPVEDLLSKHGVGFDKNNYISGVRSFYADNAGKMVGMPFNSSTPVMYYNKEAFKKAGLTLPPATWEDYEMRVAPALKKAGISVWHNRIAHGFSPRTSTRVTISRWPPTTTDLAVSKRKSCTTMTQ